MTHAQGLHPLQPQPCDRGPNSSSSPTSQLVPRMSKVIACARPASRATRAPPITPPVSPESSRIHRPCGRLHQAGGAAVRLEQRAGSAHAALPLRRDDAPAIAAQQRLQVGVGPGAARRPHSLSDLSRLLSVGSGLVVDEYRHDVPERRRASCRSPAPRCYGRRCRTPTPDAARTAAAP